MLAFDIIDKAAIFRLPSPRRRRSVIHLNADRGCRD